MTVLERARREGESALSVLNSIRTRSGGWFDCECGSCLIHGDDFHAWEAFEDHAADAIHLACVYLAERDFDALCAISTRSVDAPDDITEQPYEYLTPETVARMKDAAHGV